MAERDELQPLFLLSDEPIDSHEEDFLSRSDEARAIAGAVLGTTGPFSIGIYGEWGTGKTSLLHHVKTLLEEKESDTDSKLLYPYLVTVFFNAWQYEKDPAPLAHLAEAVNAAITRRLREAETPTDAVSRRAVGWLRSAHLAARSLAYAASIESNIEPAEELIKARRWQFWKWRPVLKFSAKDAIDRYEQLQKEVADPHSKAWKAHVGQSVTSSVLRSFRANHTVLDKVRPGVEKRIPRVVVFIDDMDRCLSDDAFNLLQSIKLAIAQPGFVFVMTLDPAALQPVIDKKAIEAGHNAGTTSKAIYLDKLVQLPYPLRLHDEQFAGFVDKIVNQRLKSMLVAPEHMIVAETNKNVAPLWQAFRDLAGVLAVSSQKNPRTLIRRINSLLLDARLAPQSVKDRFIDDAQVAAALAAGELK